MATETHCCTSILTTSIHTDDDLHQKFQIWTHHYVKTVAASSCIIWCVSDFSPCFSSLRWFLDSYQWTVDGSVEGLNRSLRSYFRSAHYFPISYRYDVQVLFVCCLFRPGHVFKDTLPSILRYAKLSANSSLGNYLVGPKYLDCQTVLLL